MSGAPSGRAIILALAASAASALCAPALAQSQNTLFGGSVELRAAYAEGSGSANPYRAELLKLGSAELGPPSSRFKLSYEVLAAAGGEPRLPLPGRLLRPLFAAVFRHRHRRLRRHFGAAESG